ncbi:MAG: iron-sulfur cluster-binding protein [Deltaproteobacteria bacterium]|nr:iron-sulfur cluster-binding protein [Deltaproteobacteria bacterium]
MDITTEKYKAVARAGTENPVLQKALAGLQARFGRGTAQAYRELPEGPDLRLVAHDLRMDAVLHLDRLLAALAGKVRGNGGHVYFAQNGEEAVAYCLKVAAENKVKRVVKGKSMVTEEIRLNEALAASGIEAVETDLGEYIIQLAGETPSHIIAPAIHKSKEDVGRLFAEKLRIGYTDDPPTLTRAARKALREKFLSADMGISGCNLACAETGHITTVSNEGNIRMASTLPRIHMVFMGMERVAARLQDLDILLRLLCRGAAAQNMATYVSHISGPRGADNLDGPEQLHLVILDNGRSRMLADPEFREMLCCIRCAACLNICPVYGKIGGHAYGFAYSGPVGAVVTPLMTGINRAADLCQGETLCGACRDACPVNIDIPRMLLLLRAKLADGDSRWGVTRGSLMEKAAYMFWARLMQSRGLYDLAINAGSVFQRALPKNGGMLRFLPPPLNGWTRSRDMQPLADESFSRWWQKNREGDSHGNP